MLALAIVAVAGGVILLGSYLPFFINSAWVPLWDAERAPAGAARSFAQVGPFCTLLPWPALLAVPIATLTLLIPFGLLVVGLLVFVVQAGHRRA
jgi:hypothetical protein